MRSNYQPRIFTVLNDRTVLNVPTVGLPLAVLTIIRNEEVIKLTAGGSFESMLANLDCELETPFITVTRTLGRNLRNWSRISNHHTN